MHYFEQQTFEAQMNALRLLPEGVDSRRILTCMPARRLFTSLICDKPFFDMMRGKCLIRSPCIRTVKRRIRLSAADKTNVAVDSNEDDPTPFDTPHSNAEPATASTALDTLPTEVALHIVEDLTLAEQVMLGKNEGCHIVAFFLLAADYVVNKPPGEYKYASGIGRMWTPRQLPKPALVGPPVAKPLPATITKSVAPSVPRPGPNPCPAGYACAPPVTGAYAVTNEYPVASVDGRAALGPGVAVSHPRGTCRSTICHICSQPAKLAATVDLVDQSSTLYKYGASGAGIRHHSTHEHTHAYRSATRAVVSQSADSAVILLLLQCQWTTSISARVHGHMAPAARTELCENCPLNNGDTHRIPASDVEHRVMLAQRRAAEEVNRLADIVTAVTFTDDGPRVREQPSKLFSSREDFQDLYAADIPICPAPIPLSEATPGVYSFVGSAIRPGMRSTERNEDVLHRIQKQVQMARKTLDDIDLLYAQNDHHQSMRLAVDAAAAVVTSSGLHLKSVQMAKGGSELLRFRDEVLEELRELDHRVDYLGALLPDERAATETTPLLYDATHIHINPIGHLDLVAQLMVLLAVVCHVVIGLSSTPCDLIIQLVQMVVRLVMSMSLTPETEEYTLHQKHVLQQLPTSLRTALDTFKLDSKTRVYASCPSCHYSHAPKEDRITGDRVYPSVCDNYLLEMNKPNGDQINHYKRPLVDELVVGWERGFHISPLGGSSSGRDVDVAVVISVNDLPAARKTAGFAAKKRERGPVAFEQEWLLYDPNQIPPAYLLNRPEKEKKQIGAIQSRLVAPFDLEDEEVDDPSTEDHEMLPVRGEKPVSFVANVDIGRICKRLEANNIAPLRFVAHSLGLDVDGDGMKLRKAEYAQKLIAWRLTKPLALADCHHHWVPYTDQVTTPYRLKNATTELPQILKIQSILTDLSVTGTSAVLPHTPLPVGNEVPLPAPVAMQDPNVAKAAAAFTKSLKHYNLPSLRFVAYSLGLDMSGKDEKANYMVKLTAWVSLIQWNRYSAPNESFNSAAYETARQYALCSQGH
ncbi:hypothetical protein C8R43DRAFT_952250 [Mycena crocata]|nr:hypothetical protein C8R43DRAFT_952250 [Mycena crocata]